jgi:hypothetical protein
MNVIDHVISYKTNSYANSTMTIEVFNYYDTSYTATNNIPIEWPEEIVIKKLKYKIDKNIGNYSKPVMNKKQYSRLVCRRG